MAAFRNQNSMTAFRRSIWREDSHLATHFCQSRFSKAASRPKPNSATGGLQSRRWRPQSIGQNRPQRMLTKFFIPKSSEWQLFGKQPCFLFCSTRPLTAGREWRLCGDEYSGQCDINSDGVIVMSTVLAFWHPWKPLKSRDTVLSGRQKVSNCLAAKQQKLSSLWIPCKIVKRTHQKQQVT